MAIVQIACDMHADFVKRAKGGAVVKALRAAHFLDWLPGEGGLVKVNDQDSLLFPAGGHRVDPSWSEPKEAWMQPVLNQAGETVAKPLPCDWSKLNKLRKEAESKKKNDVDQPLPGMAEESLT